VSVVIAARDEERSLARSLSSVLAQDYPRDRMEVIVVAGGCTDGTARVARDLAPDDGRIRVLEIADGRTPVALNAGIRAARGDVIARVDAHGWIAPDYLSTSLEVLVRTAADAVGGVVRFTGVGATGEAIALAMGSRLGAGTAPFRSAARERESDGLMWGVYRRSVFDRVGPFDERLLRNQDDELCHRLCQHGGRMVVSPDMHFWHVARPSFRTLWRQFFEWGGFRVATVAKHRRPATVRQVLPPLLVGGLGAAVVMQAGGGTRRRAGRAALAAYATLATGGGTWVAGRAGRLRAAPAVATAVATMQVAYGAGFWWAAVTAAAAPGGALPRRARSGRRRLGRSPA